MPVWFQMYSIKINNKNRLYVEREVNSVIVL